MSDRSVRVRAFAKINLTLRVLGSSDDGYHELRTVFQSIGVYDTLTFTSTRSGWSIECSDSRCPADRTNLVWRAAESLWHEMGRRGMPSGVRVGIRKRIPMEAGLGGGSSDAAATLRALAHLWRFSVGNDRLQALCRRLGADVSYFLHGGTVLGLGRGDLLFRLVDWPSSWVVLVVPEQRVRTADAYRWWDRQRGRASRRRGTTGPTLITPAFELTNDLQPTVAAHHPVLAGLPNQLRRLGAYHAMLSGSGSAIFGLFEHERAARSAAATLSRRHATLVTRTVSRRRFETASSPYGCPPKQR